MIAIPVAEAANAISATFSQSYTGLITQVSTDTRENVDGSLFFALRGENSDGHAYVRQAFDKGAVAAVVDHPVNGVEGPQLVVQDTLLSLGDLAAHYRSKFDIPVVGVTGSVGKTSTKEMIASVLGAKYTRLVSAKNYNNEIGVPHTLFSCAFIAMCFGKSFHPSL